MNTKNSKKNEQQISTNIKWIKNEIQRTPNICKHKENQKVIEKYQISVSKKTFLKKWWPQDISKHKEDKRSQLNLDIGE